MKITEDSIFVDLIDQKEMMFQKSVIEKSVIERIVWGSEVSFPINTP